MKKAIPAIVFAALILSLSLLTLLLPKQKFSDNLNRYLAEFPEPTWTDVKSGKFGSDLSDWLADHFVLHDAWVSIKSFSVLASFDRENNGVYKGSDGYLIDSFDESSAAGFDGNLSSLSDFERLMSDKYGVAVKEMIAPTATQILSDKLPANAPVADGGALLARAGGTLEGFVDVSASLRPHSDEYIYYRTDHHWTTLGAAYAYLDYRVSLGLDPVGVDELGIGTVTDEFFGTLYSRYGLFNGKNADTLCAPDESSLSVVSVQKKDGTYDSLYFPDKLEGKDKYLYFLGGNDAKLDVDTGLDTGRTLLLIKDSYANCFLPFLTRDFDRIIVVDMRYYKGLIPELVSSEGVTDVLVLYNLKSFCEDKYLQFLCDEG